MDSFSKVISSGIRLGFMTAAAPLIASVELHLQSSHLHAPTLSQVGGNITLRTTLRDPSLPLLLRVAGKYRCAKTPRMYKILVNIGGLFTNYFNSNQCGKLQLILFSIILIFHTSRIRWITRCLHLNAKRKNRFIILFIYVKKGR